MKVLVTGGLGYIGSHTVVELIDNNYEVVIIGAGAVGLAIAKELQENQCKSVIVLEKNSNFIGICLKK